MQNESVELELALQLLSLPKTIGTHPESDDLVVADYGRYGPYLKCGKTNAKLFPPLTPLTVTLQDALPLLAKSQKGSVELKIIGAHPASGADLVL